jgi:hypothetical protein
MPVDDNMRMQAAPGAKNYVLANDTIRTNVAIWSEFGILVDYCG